MNSASYKLILYLLIGCVCFVLSIQAYWMYSFYTQKKLEFDGRVYSAMEQIAGRLQQRKKLESLKMTYFIQNGDTIARTPSRRITVLTSQDQEVVNNNGQIEITERHIDSARVRNTKFIKDSLVIKNSKRHINMMVGGKKANLIINNAKRLLETETDTAINSLVDRMLTEIRIMDTETENADTLETLIRKVLVNKGLNTPFEFSLQNRSLAIIKTLANSRGFSEKQPYYSSDLSLNQIIPNYNFLLLQFPEQTRYVMASIKGSMALSFIFSFLIIGIFIYVTQLIFKQKKISEIKNDFINNMTHELKTPIATISLATDAIVNPMIKNDEEKFKEYIRILKEENQKLDKHVEHVLQMALIERGELRLNKTNTDLSRLLLNTSNTFKLQAGKIGARVNLQASHPLLIMADGQHLQAVFNNLLDNALKYSKDNCEVTIDLNQVNAYAVVSFKDNGIGIDRDKKEKVFDKFYRVQGGNLHDVKGFGLGLSYVRSIVEAHGGKVELRSEIGKGSEFIVTLPSN